MPAAIGEAGPAERVEAPTMAFPLPVPGAVKAMALLEDCSYEDAFGAGATSEHSPGEWARLIVSAAPGPLLRGIRFAQSRLLQLDLGP